MEHKAPYGKQFSNLERIPLVITKMVHEWITKRWPFLLILFKGPQTVICRFMEQSAVVYKSLRLKRLQSSLAISFEFSAPRNVNSETIDITKENRTKFQKSISIKHHSIQSVYYKDVNVQVRLTNGVRGSAMLYEQLPRFTCFALKTIATVHELFSRLSEIVSPLSFLNICLFQSQPPIFPTRGWPRLEWWRNLTDLRVETFKERNASAKAAKCVSTLLTRNAIGHPQC